MSAIFGFIITGIIILGLGWQVSSPTPTPTTTTKFTERTHSQQNDKQANADLKQQSEQQYNAQKREFASTLESYKQQIKTQMESMLLKNSGGGKTFLEVADLDITERKRILVTGGSGFVGSHLVDKLMKQGHEVYVMDNFFTGRRSNVEHWIGHPHFELIHHDVTQPYLIEVDQIYHLASPASPPHYQLNPIKTIKTNTIGTMNMLGLARRTKARFLLASTSEIYGDPEVHPQKETYWGNVNTIGPRACYDEGKRMGETMSYAYKKQEGVDVRVARIFNTFGPRMHPEDGRVVSNFIIQALKGENITIYGTGNQTRSFQYVEDLVDGLMALMNGEYDQPVNLGNPDEYTISDFAEYINELTGSKSEIIRCCQDRTVDDPKQRKPDITVAKRELGWAPKWKVRDGLQMTIDYFQKEVMDRINKKKQEL
eukprot:Pgem_evm1s18852